MLTLFSCNQSIKFDSSKWNIKDDIEYSYRDKMVEDLTANNKLIGLRYSQLIKLLGNPQVEDSLRISYKIIDKYGNDIDPVYSKYLDFTFSKDSIIISFKINEWEK